MKAGEFSSCVVCYHQCVWRHTQYKGTIKWNVSAQPYHFIHCQTSFRSKEWCGTYTNYIMKVALLQIWYKCFSYFLAFCILLCDWAYFKKEHTLLHSKEKVLKKNLLCVKKKNPVNRPSAHLRCYEVLWAECHPWLSIIQR